MAGVSTSAYNFFVNAGRLTAALADSSGGPLLVLQGATPVANGQWHHVAMVRDTTAGQFRLYVDGQVDATAPLGLGSNGDIKDNDGSPDHFLIGAQYVQGTSVIDTPIMFPGRIDEVSYWSRAVSASQLNATFSAGGRRDLAGEFLPPPGEYSTLKGNPNGTYTRSLKDGTTYQFNAQGYQTALADRNGNQTTYAYNGSNHLTTITDPTGQVTTLSYTGTRLATLTDPAGRATSFTYDSAGNLITVDAADQTQQRFAYDAQHRLTQRTDARNQVYAYQFDHAGRLQRATLPDGAFREIRPTELTAVPNLAAGQGTPGNPATITQPPIVQATFKDAKGQTTTFETDAIGRVTKQIDPLNRTTIITRDPQGNPLTITRPNGAVTTMTYDAKGNLLTSTEQAIAATTSFVYEPVFNQVTRITDPKGNQTNITYDVKGNPLTITDADNKVTRFFYNVQGLLTETRDALYPANPATTFTYDVLGRLLTTTDPLNRTTTLTYDSAGNVATSTDALTRVTSFQYDQKNRLKQVTDPATGVTVYTYDGNGNLLTVKDAKNQTTTFAYDDRNRLLSTTDPLGKVEAYSYDGNDNLLTRVTPKAETISFAYDAVNQSLSKTLPGSQITSYQYDLVGNLTNVTDPDSVLAMTYDPANRLTSVKTDGSSNQPAVTLTSAYDPNGNRVAMTDPTQTTAYFYDVLNRLTQIGVPTQSSCPALPAGLVSHWRAEGTAADAVGSNHGTLRNGATFGLGVQGQAFQLDGIDDFVEVPDASALKPAALTMSFWVKLDTLFPANTSEPGLQWLVFKRNTRLTSFFNDYAVAKVFRNGRHYFIFGNNGATGQSAFIESPTNLVTGQWYHVLVTANAVEMRFYLNGALEGSAPMGFPLDHATTPLVFGATNEAIVDGKLAGQLDEVQFYNRVLAPAEVGQTLCQPMTTYVQATTYTYDALSRRTAMTLPNGTQTTYTYDPASQVTQVLHQLQATSSQVNKAEYGYNGVGNRTSLTDRRGVQSFGYDPLDRLTSASHPLLGTPQAFAYDPVGNRTTGGSVVNAGNQLTADATHSYQYDDNGNLIRKTLLATGNFTQYTYDAENRLVKVEDFAAGATTPTAISTYRYDGLGRRIEKVTPTGTRRYIYDGEDIVLEYDGSNVLQARYTHGPGIDEPIAVTKGGSTFFYHQDGLGTVTELTDSAGATAKSYSYDAYGTLVDQTGTVDQPYTYTGREFDAESGLYYYRARAYDPMLGRFLRYDPIGFGGGSANLYEYVKNNPGNAIDPNGLFPRRPSRPINPGQFFNPPGLQNACSYYTQQCAESGGKCDYYCKLGPTACRFAGVRLGLSPQQTSGIRGCLIQADQDAKQNVDNYSNNSCPSCLKDSVIDEYHRSCFAKYGVSPGVYPGIPPGLGND
ncbi:MAG: LamG-like jellyroll fold domain-containing protein [Nitrospirota bacterium]